uniref:Secreted protein n=1 Tax=Parastrongyloides trichosuri TaxID=131310 RepID=A0A0N4YZX5_PARTI
MRIAKCAVLAASVLAASTMIASSAGARAPGIMYHHTFYSDATLTTQTASRGGGGFHHKVGSVLDHPRRHLAAILVPQASATCRLNRRLAEAAVDGVFRLDHAVAHAAVGLGQATHSGESTTIGPPLRSVVREGVEFCVARIDQGATAGLQGFVDGGARGGQVQNIAQVAPALAAARHDDLHLAAFAHVAGQRAGAVADGDRGVLGHVPALVVEVIVLEGDLQDARCAGFRRQAADQDLERAVHAARADAQTVVKRGVGDDQLLFGITGRGGRGPGLRRRSGRSSYGDFYMAVGSAGQDAAGADVHLDALGDDQADGEDHEGVGDDHGVQMPGGGVDLHHLAQARPCGEQADHQDQAQRRGLGLQRAVRLLLDGDGLAAPPAGDAAQAKRHDEGDPGEGVEMRMLGIGPQAKADRCRDQQGHDPQQMRPQGPLAPVAQQDDGQGHADADQRPHGLRRHVKTPSERRLPSLANGARKEGSGRGDRLFDGAEDGVMLVVQHLDADGVAVLEEGGLGRAGLDGLDRADLGDAGIAQAALGHRLARAAVGALVRHRARADDRPGDQRAGLGQVGDQDAEVEGHVDAGVRLAKVSAVQLHQQGAGQLAVLPAIAQRIRRDEDRRQGAGRLGLEEAEALGQLARNQVAQRDIVDQADQTDRRQSLVAGRALGHVAGDDDDLGFQVAAPGLVLQRDGVAGAEEVVGAALIHQRVGPEGRRHLGVAGFAHQFDVVHIGRAVSPLIGAGQGGGGLVLAEAAARHGFVLQALGQGPQQGLAAVPVIQRRLQRGRDQEGVREPVQVVGDDDEAAVTAVLERGEFHEAKLVRPEAVGKRSRWPRTPCSINYSGVKSRRGPRPRCAGPDRAPRPRRRWRRRARAPTGSGARSRPRDRTGPCPHRHRPRG